MRIRIAVAATLALLLLVLALPACVSGMYHKVGEGENLYRIAKTYGVSQEAIARVNKLKDANAIYAGQYLFIPGATERKVVLAAIDRQAPATPPAATEPPAAEPPTRIADGRSAITEEDLAPTSPVIPPPVSPPPREAVDPPASVLPAPAPVIVEEPRPAALPKGTKGDFHPIWPARGTVIERFGGSGDAKCDGIRIAAVEGTPVLAASSGRVMHSGVLTGYGKIVVVKHDDVYATIYAHNRRNLVKEGQQVAQGQQIAEMGSSGRARQVHLYFEVIEDRKSVDPTTYLPAR